MVENGKNQLENAVSYIQNSFDLMSLNYTQHTHNALQYAPDCTLKFYLHVIRFQSKVFPVSSATFITVNISTPRWTRLTQHQLSLSHYITSWFAVTGSELHAAVTLLQTELTVLLHLPSPPNVSDVTGTSSSRIREWWPRLPFRVKIGGGSFKLEATTIHRDMFRRRRQKQRQWHSLNVKEN